MEARNQEHSGHRHGEERGEERIDERRAAVLLGMTTEELRRLSRRFGLGQLEKNEHNEQMVFTYEELRRLCLLAAPSFD